MSLLGKKFPVKVVQPMWPFYSAGLIIAYGINSLATSLAQSDEYKNDPRNPALKNTTKGH
ncbi:hypothetical protein WHR41_08017 [Cladosporium halotolerans]|uniref:Mitochondrial F1F0 ATP synthase subunit Atp18 n=1 Tax=Cladosporium halotolerans TaxID=1052096 RepID=A0AB34KF67_9PEZI